MTQSLEGATVLVSLAPSSGDAWPPAPCPDGRASDPGTADGPAAPPPGALLPAAGPAALPSWSELGSQPGQRSRLPQLGSPGPRGWAGGPRLAPEQPSGKPRLQEPWEVAREAQVSGKKEDNWRGADDPAPFPLPMLAPQPGPMHRRRRGGRLLRAPAPDGGVPGQRLLPPGIRSSPISPGGVLYPCTGFATNFAGEGREGGGRLPSTVPGGRARGARDGARPETSSAGGAERGGGHRRSYSRFARGSQLGPAPRSLSLTCLTPPQPGPAPCQRLSLPARAATPPPVRVMAAAAALGAVAPTGALWGLVQDFVMGQQEGPADQVTAGTADGAARLPLGGLQEGAASAQAPGGKGVRDSGDFERLVRGWL
ncbi:hypothetical protein J1605_021880 [Eschrichtius robustus]|uniref:Uncharacterized protein n=1 Tax=Eschrichtius robustus TaxID=9764 RepID=A0AB34HBG4_ESCRO|nr:hypothetical protein J1605_021880 [Eschrichtius robustus]